MDSGNESPLDLASQASDMCLPWKAICEMRGVDPSLGDLRNLDLEITLSD